MIKWNASLFGVEIESEGVRFVVDANRSYIMNWYDAVRFYSNPHRSHTWQLPARKHLKLIVEHIDEVNALIKANGGYEIQGWHWTADEYDEFCAWFVNMYNGYTLNSNKYYYYYYVRAVSALNNKEK